MLYREINIMWAYDLSGVKTNIIKTSPHESLGFCGICGEIWQGRFLFTTISSTICTDCLTPLWGEWGMIIKGGKMFYGYETEYFSLDTRAAVYVNNIHSGVVVYNKNTVRPLFMTVLPSRFNRADIRTSAYYTAEFR